MGLMRRRIFIAINLPENIKKVLTSLQGQISGLPVRWVKPENLHLTLIFIGYVSDQQLLEIEKKAKEAISKHSSFFLRFNKVCYGPPKKIPPRMVWVLGEKSAKLSKLRADLENSLAGVKISFDQKELAPHITLGRIRTFEWRQIEPEERPEVEREIDLSFEVLSVEIMESKLKPQGAQYTILESIPLKKQ